MNHVRDHVRLLNGLKESFLANLSLERGLVDLNEVVDDQLNGICHQRLFWKES